MTLQHDPQTSLVEAPVAKGGRPGAARWALPLGGVALVAAFVIGSGQFSDGETERPGGVNATGVANRTDYTRAQVLVQQSIDEALAANQHTNTYTQAQATIQRYIDEALRANGW